MGEHSQCFLDRRGECKGHFGISNCYLVPLKAQSMSRIRALRPKLSASRIVRTNVVPGVLKSLSPSLHNFLMNNTVVSLEAVLSFLIDKVCRHRSDIIQNDHFR